MSVHRCQFCDRLYVHPSQIFYVSKQDMVCPSCRAEARQNTDAMRESARPSPPPRSES